MSLAKKVKVGLDETRILILGSQILLGFGFQTVFRPGFQNPPLHDRLAQSAALGLITIAVGLIIAPSAQHRIVEGGADTKRLLDEIRWCATWALAPFALSLGLNVFLAAERVTGTWPGAAIGAGICAAAAAFWFALEWARMRTEGRELREKERDEPEREHTPLDKKIEQMLTETRVVLPGAQALLGFQLIIVFSDTFEKLPAAAKGLHLAALGCVALSVIWLMAPAAYHRIVYAGEDAPDFHRTGTRFLLAASFALAVGIACDLGVVVGKVLGSGAAGAAAGALSFTLLTGMWHAYPAWLRSRGRGGNFRATGAL